jgi:hypothetical protein
MIVYENKNIKVKQVSSVSRGRETPQKEGRRRKANTQMLQPKVLKPPDSNQEGPKKSPGGSGILSRLHLLETWARMLWPDDPSLWTTTEST